LTPTPVSPFLRDVEQLILKEREAILQQPGHLIQKTRGRGRTRRCTCGKPESVCAGRCAKRRVAKRGRR
jgi:hypothetical protein